MAKQPNALQRLFLRMGGYQPPVAEPPQISKAQQLAELRAKILGLLSGLTVGEALSVLSGILAEQTAPYITSVQHVQDKIEAINAIAEEMVRENFLYLLAGTLDAYVRTDLAELDKQQAKAAA